jgi:hypothetical protein
MPKNAIVKWLSEDLRWFRLILLLVFLVGPLCWSLPGINRIRDSYQTPVPATVKESPQAIPKPAGIPAGEAQSGSKPVPEPLSQQNKQMLDWGVLLLGGIIGLVTVTKVHIIGKCEWLFLTVAPAASFLLGSLAAGIVFQRRVAYLSVQPTPDSIDSLNELLKTQSNQLEYAILTLSVFALIFLFGIIAGIVKPHD